MEQATIKQCQQIHYLALYWGIVPVLSNRKLLRQLVLHRVAKVIGREVSSTKELTREEANQVLSEWRNWKQEETPINA